MAVLKLVLLAIALLGIGVAGFAIKLFFQKDAKPINTSCGAVGSELQHRGVDACATGGCSTEKIEACKAEGKFDFPTLELKS